ncbi:MAG TPA: flagellar hook assembly protein FlgD [Telluria sp.]|nr:flagellar hook assembly protein FlgD [Telluria sp.]
MAITATTGPSSDLLNAVNGKKKSAADEVKDATDKFMTLLVTQLKNQDPLNPMDNAQITSQLAQLSTVTGVNKLNDTLESLKDSYRSSEALSATNMIGRGVLIEGSDMTLQKSQGLLGVELDSPADSVKLVISDSSGREVHTIDLGAQQAGIVPVAWDGIATGAKLDADGAPIPVPDGSYSFRVVATRGGDPITDVRPLQFDSVASVTTSSKDGVKLNLPYKGTVTMADIKQIL